MLIGQRVMAGAGVQVDGPDKELLVMARSAADDFAATVRDGAPTMVGRPQERLLGGLASLNEMADRSSAVEAPDVNAAVARAEAVDLKRNQDDVVEYDSYFGLGRTAQISATAQALAAVETMIEMTATLTRAPGLAGDDAAAIADLMTRILGAAVADDYEWPSATTVAGDQLAEVVARSVAVELTPLGRWKTGHRMYGLANREAARELDAAVDAYQRGHDEEQVAAHMLGAADGIAAVTATMLYASSMTSVQYLTEVRHTMNYPCCSVELTGAMNLDHARYRVSMRRFLAEFRMPYAELVEESKVVADARERVLDLDLVDLTDHISLTHRLVGAAPALDERDDGSAVQRLRSMLVDRTQQYAYMQRLGGRTLRPWKGDDSRGTAA